MLKNYFATAFRNLWRNKIFSLINTLGLAIGISAALVIFLIVHYEFSYDKFEPGADRIYRVVLNMVSSGTKNQSAAVPAPLGAAVETEVTGVEQVSPVFQFQGDATAKVAIATSRSENPVVYKKQPDIVFAGKDYFHLLPHRWIAGSPEASLTEPFAVVLTESRAAQYFPSVPISDLIGKRITYNDDLVCTVSGVVADLNKTTDFKAVEFISLSTIAKTNLQDAFMMKVWNDWMAYSQLYIKLSKGSTVANTEAQLSALIKKYNPEAEKNPGNTMSFQLQPLNDIHFHYAGVGQRLAHKPTLYGLMAIAAFLLLLGCINFINLTTAHATQRAKEIGIRKTMGGSRSQLVFQFLSETFFLTLLASILSVALTPLLISMFASFIPPGLHFDLLNQPVIGLFLLALVVTVSFLAGLYPALVLSRYNPVLVLKGQAITNSGQTRKSGVRKTLTVAQFVIAQFFIIATIMVSRQINYSLHTDLGFKKDAIISFEIPRDTSISNRFVLLQKINKIPQIEMASIGFLPPAANGPAFTTVKYTGGENDVKDGVQIRWGDTNYLKLYHIKLLAGRNVQQSDTIKEFVINETYAKMLGFRQAGDALGKQLEFNHKKIPIVGVVQDFHERSLHDRIDPVVFGSFTQRSNFFHLALKPQDADGSGWQTGISQVEKAFKEIYPESDFNYSFLDEQIAKFYKSERNTARLLAWATGLTIFISCLGLLGLVIYITNTRTKEIGIRKILGASVTSIVSILSKDFVQLVLLAFIIAAPLAWWASYQWLQNFTYKTNMSWWVFALSGLAMLAVALVTLIAQTIKTALANPVESLRTE